MTNEIKSGICWKCGNVLTPKNRCMHCDIDYNNIEVIEDEEKGYKETNKEFEEDYTTQRENEIAFSGHNHDGDQRQTR